VRSTTRGPPRRPRQNVPSHGSSHIQPSAKSISFNACNYLIIPDDTGSPSGSLAYLSGVMQDFIAHTLWAC
jgi:hypothetical protein